MSHGNSAFRPLGLASTAVKKGNLPHQIYLSKPKFVGKKSLNDCKGNDYSFWIQNLWNSTGKLRQNLH